MTWVVTHLGWIAVRIVIDIAELLVWRGEHVARILGRVLACPRLVVGDVHAVHKLIDAAPRVFNTPVAAGILAVRIAAYTAAGCRDA